MTRQSPAGRYLVISTHHLQEQGSANVVPAARYDILRDAIAHCESVTYRMGVMDSKAESRGFVYRNWESPPTSTPWGQVQHSTRLAVGIWSVSTASHGGIWLSESRVDQLNEILPILGGKISHYPTFCGAAEWWEEDCDWCIPVIAFNLEHYEAACRQLRSMQSMGDKYKRAVRALIAAGKMLDSDKVKQAVAPKGWESVEA